MKIVSFEISKKLKEKGFDCKVNAYYKDTNKIFNTGNASNLNILTGVYSAPTISQVLDWLREHNIYIVVFINDDTDNPVTYEIYKGVECVMCDHKYYSLSEWNNAEIDAIEYVLDRLM